MLKLFSAFLMIAFLVCPSLGVEHPVVAGEWVVNQVETVKANYAGMKAANPSIMDLESMTKAAAAVSISEKVIIEDARICLVQGPDKRVYSISDKWIEEPSGAHYFKTTMTDGIGHEYVRTFCYLLKSDGLKSVEIVNGTVILKILDKSAQQGGRKDIENFLNLTVREMETQFQAGGYDDEDGNGIGSYCFIPALLFGAAQGDAKVAAFMKDVKEDLKRKAQFEYKSIINDGWLVKIIPNGGGRNPKETGYKAIVFKHKISYTAFLGSQAILSSDYDDSADK